MAFGKKTLETKITISPPEIHTFRCKIVGTAPYVQHAFSQKARLEYMATQEAGDKKKSKKQRDPKDFEACYENATHRSVEGWFGIPASSFRNAMISACRVAGVVMTQAKLCIFVAADGFDAGDGSPLVRIYGERRRLDSMVRNETGVIDVRARPQWLAWYAFLQVDYDSTRFDAPSVANLLARAGNQVGIGEGRPDSKNSAGMGWGTFRVEPE